ncbi:anaphase-promoting complex subunit Hcn1 [Phlyctochytrium bullatum]|nr:anaphase-promoting complex subunit Hcn1 [Phlyctochytrium bullatum]
MISKISCKALKRFVQLKSEYDEFIQATKHETESYRRQQQAEYNDLRQQFETHRLQQFEEKKRLMAEYSGLLYGMQAQFEEYRLAAEFMFNIEIEKLEDELSMQALRYEHEIMYVVQAKDKFYSDMMVSKDAKIMSLIEGSDLQALIQKHELDIENLRKDHAREIERIKSDQESEQKNIIALLQRQNVSLESKCDKLQAHLKTLESRIRELLGTIDSKNKALADRDEQRIRMETEFEETADLHLEFEQMSSRYDGLLCENQVLVKRLREREKFAEFLEKEVARRTEEFVNLSLSNLIAKPPTRPTLNKAYIPSKGETLPVLDFETKESEEDAVRKAEIARAEAYLKRFKSLSQAFATGEFRIIPQGAYETSPDGPPSLWQKASLYGKLDDANLTLARLYKEGKGTLNLDKPPIYHPEVSQAVDSGKGVVQTLSQIVDTQAVKLYESKNGGISQSIARGIPGVGKGGEEQEEELAQLQHDILAFLIDHADHLAQAKHDLPTSHLSERQSYHQPLKSSGMIAHASTEVTESDWIPPEETKERSRNWTDRAKTNLVGESADISSVSSMSPQPSLASIYPHTRHSQSAKGAKRPSKKFSSDVPHITVSGAVSTQKTPEHSLPMPARKSPRPSPAVRLPDTLIEFALKSKSNQNLNNSDSGDAPSDSNQAPLPSAFSTVMHQNTVNSTNYSKVLAQKMLMKQGGNQFSLASLARSQSSQMSMIFFANRGKKDRTANNLLRGSGDIIGSQNDWLKPKAYPSTSRNSVRLSSNANLPHPGSKGTSNASRYGLVDNLHPPAPNGARPRASAASNTPSTLDTRIFEEDGVYYNNDETGAANRSPLQPFQLGRSRQSQAAKLRLSHASHLADAGSVCNQSHGISVAASSIFHAPSTELEGFLEMRKAKSEQRSVSELSAAGGPDSTRQSEHEDSIISEIRNEQAMPLSKFWIWVASIYLEKLRTAGFNELGEHIKHGPRRQMLMVKAVEDSGSQLCLHPLSAFVVFWELAAFVLCVPPWLAFSHQSLNKYYAHLLMLPELIFAFIIVVRVYRNNPILDNLQNRMQQTSGAGSNFVRVALFFVVFLVYLHFFACVISLLVENNSMFEWNDTWKPNLSKGEPKPVNVPLNNLRGEGEVVFRRYILMFFGATSDLLASAGYHPSYTIEQMIHICMTLTGALIYALLVGAVASFSFGLDAGARKFKEKIDEVNEYMESCDLPEDLRRRIRNYFELKYKGRYFKSEDIMHELNGSLQRDILLESFRSLLERVPFFQRKMDDGRDEAFVGRMAEAVTMMYFVAGNNVFIQGQKGEDMFFILQGTVDIIVNGTKVGALAEGSFFGEVALMDSSPRSATITASGQLILVRLAKSDLEPILLDFPDVRVKMREVYQERLARIERERAAAKK